MLTRQKALKYSTILFAYLLVVWGLYRFVFQLPEEVEELLVKPVVWLTPVLILLYKEKSGLKSIGLTLSNIFPAIYFALSLGAVFAIEGLVINYFKYGQISFNANLGENAFGYALGISLATAISEEIAFRGYIFNRVLFSLKNELYANLLTSFGWALVNAPIAVFAWKMSITATIVYVLLAFLYGVGASFVFARSKNVLSPILLHVFWEWPIILFR